MILRTCVVIPCFDNPRTISQVLKDVVVATPYPILLIDDGSETPVTNVLYSFEVKQALETGRLRVVRFEKNRGKGAALRYAILDLVSKGFTHMITLTGDGLHRASEIGKLTELGRRHPWDLIIGNRGLKAEPVGRLQGWANRVLNYCVRFETGSRLQDTRSGFRLYPLFPLQTMRFRTRRYDWELEVLIRLLWKGTKVREVDVKTTPFNPSEHALPSNGLTDLIRLSVLNLLWITVALLRTHASPIQLARSMGIGVFVGCTPVFGFQTFIMIVLAVMFPLNFAAMWIGNHVSTPLLFPFLMMGEVFIGQHWLGIKTSEGMMGHFYQWAAGSVVMGFLLSVPAALITYLVANAFQKPPAAPDLASAQAGRHKFLRFLVFRLGIGVTYAWLPVLSLWRYMRMSRARRGLNEYYRVLIPGQPFWPRQIQVLRHIHRCAQIQADGLALSLKVHPGVITKSEGHLEDAMAAQPVILTAHLGCWEAAASSLQPATHLVYGDQPSGHHYELISFFGKMAPFDVSPFYNAVKSQKPMLFSIGVKEKGRVYELHSGPPRKYVLRPETPSELQVLEWAGRYARHLEFYVRRYPDQWFNLYPFWSSLPPQHETYPGIFIEDLQSAQMKIPKA